MELSPAPILPRALIGGVNQLLVVGSCRTVRTYKEEAGDTRDEVHHDLLSLQHSLDPIAKAQQQWKAPHRVASKPSACARSRARLIDLLPLHRVVHRQRLIRCRALRPSPLVRCANPNPKDLSHFFITLDRLGAVLTDP
jgi:hypothetical protein